MVLLLDYYSYERIIPFIYAKVSYMDTTFLIPGNKNEELYIAVTKKTIKSYNFIGLYCFKIKNNWLNNPRERITILFHRYLHIGISEVQSR